MIFVALDGVADPDRNDDLGPGAGAVDLLVGTYNGTNWLVTLAKAFTMSPSSKKCFASEK